MERIFWGTAPCGRDGVQGERCSSLSRANAQSFQQCCGCALWKKKKKASSLAVVLWSVPKHSNIWKRFWNSCEKQNANPQWTSHRLAYFFFCWPPLSEHFPFALPITLWHGIAPAPWDWNNFLLKVFFPSMWRSVTFSHAPWEGLQGDFLERLLAERAVGKKSVHDNTFPKKAN